MTTTTKRKPISGASPIKRPRRTKAEIDRLREQLHNIVAAGQPMTVRQTYYRAVARQVIPKTQGAYKGVVCRLLTDMRRTGEMPFEWIVDSTRLQRKPETYGSLGAMLALSTETYRRALWLTQAEEVEVWCESDSIGGVLYEVTSKWDVPLMSCRGYPSLSFIHGAAMALAATSWPNHLYYFGDHDPSGKDITRFVETELRKWAPDAEIHFRQAAVTPEQIEEWSLPTNPTKRSDSRAKGFEGGTVELEAIEPGELRSLCERCIVQHVDDDALEATMRAEEAERETLQQVAASLGDGTDW